MAGQCVDCDQCYTIELEIVSISIVVSIFFCTNFDSKHWLDWLIVTHTHKQVDIISQKYIHKEGHVCDANTFMIIYHFFTFLDFLVDKRMNDIVII